MHRSVLTLLLTWSAGALAASEAGVDAETGLSTWQTETGGIQVRLTQISPDQARAFYQARGFSPEAAERYARECVFMTVVRNVGDAPIEHRLADWRYVPRRQPPRALRSKAEWARIWEQMEVAAPARIAFTWAQLPSAQTFAPGDWNQGMTTYDVPRGGRFDLNFVWHRGGRTLSATLEGVQCAREAP